MLKSLLIKNYALIRHLELLPSEKLNIITGETGAGKSIMLGAIGLLLGNRADSKVLYDQNQKCVIEGNFDTKVYDLREVFDQIEIEYDESNCIIRREISPAGKSRAFINDTPATLDTVKILGRHLMDIHSQHDTQMLGSSSYQLSIIDNFAQNKHILKKYHAGYSDYKKARQAYQDLLASSVQAKNEFDYNNFLLEELSAANLQDLNQEDLEAQLQLLENAEEVKTKLSQAYNVLEVNETAVNQGLKSVVQLIDKANGLAPQFEQLATRARSCLIELRELASEIQSEEESIEYDPEKIVTIQENLSIIYNLQKKHSVQSIEELIRIRTHLEKKVSLVENLDQQILDFKLKEQQYYSILKNIAAQLSKSRQDVFANFENQVKQLFAEVGMPNAVLTIGHSVLDVGNMGIDQINLLFSANKGIAVQDLKNVASGGEFSRLMLVIKYVLAGKSALPTIIFDEIDTGISGEIAIKVGAIMQQMAFNHQIIVITHLPQIAARGQTHYYVYKDNQQERTISKIKLLNQSEREQEIAQMISGEPPTQTSVNNARELLEMSQ